MYAGGSAGGIALLIYGVPFMISGQQFTHLEPSLSKLIAIRIATERQTAALTVLAERVGRSTPYAAGKSQKSADKVRDQAEWNVGQEA